MTGSTNIVIMVTFSYQYNFRNRAGMEISDLWIRLEACDDSEQRLHTFVQLFPRIQNRIRARVDGG